MKKILIGLVLVVALLAGGFGIAQATIPSADGTIHACYKNSTGDLRVIDGDTSSCTTGYTAINWDQTDTAGLAGLERVTAEQTAEVPTGSGVSATATCPAGKILIGGGIRHIDYRFAVVSSQPVVGQERWLAEAVNTLSVPESDTVTAFAFCAFPFGAAP